MGLICKILFSIWLSFSLVISLFSSLEVSRRVAKHSHDLNGQTCVDNLRFVSPALMILVLITSVVGILATLCQLRLLQSLCNFLFNVGVFVLMFYSIYLILGLGFFRDHPVNSYNNVYYKNEPLKQEFRWLLLETVANDHPWAWQSVEKCFDHIHFCGSQMDPRLRREYPRLVESCCNPPSRCGLFKAPGSKNKWEAPKIGLNFTQGDEDCERWLNKGLDDKCFECDTCKAARILKFSMDFGFLNRQVKAFAIFNIVSSIFIMFGALDNNREPRGYYS